MWEFIWLGFFTWNRGFLGERLLTSVQAARLACAGPVTNALIGYSTLSKSQLASPLAAGLDSADCTVSMCQTLNCVLACVRSSSLGFQNNFFPSTFITKTSSFLNKADFWQVLQSFVLCFVFVSSGLVQDPANKGLASYLCSKLYSHTSFSTLDFSLMTQYVLSN